MHPLIPPLAQIAGAHSTASLRFVARELPFAREILRELARERGALVGWEGTTLRQLAGEFATSALDARGLRVADDLELQAAADDSLDATQSTLPAPLRRQVGSLGFRTAAFDAFAQLRIAGVSADQLSAAARAGSPAEALVPAYARYCAMLAERRLADAGDVFRFAIDAAGAQATLGDVVVIEPGASDTSGLPLAFVDTLRARGAHCLELSHACADWPPAKLEPVFSRAFTPALEVREALRQAVADGLRWDEVELAASDVDTYGAALASLGDELGIPYSLKEGVPMVRSRPGRAVERYLRWLQDGLPATTIRIALEQGELVVDAAQGGDVARALRSAQIGWGRDRWIDAETRFSDGRWVAERLDDRYDPDARLTVEERKPLLEAAAVATAHLIRQLAPLMPPVPAPAAKDPDVERIATHDLAGRVIGWLDLVAPGLVAPADRLALERLRGRLRQLAGHERPSEPLRVAISELRQGLSDLRAFPSADGSRARRSSAPGAVHLTDLTQAGSTGRRRVCLVGVDADRMSPLASTDPILDEETRATVGASLPSIRRRTERRERAIYRALAGLAGDVRLSYATQGESAGRESSPAPLLLESARRRYGKPTMSYDELRKTLGAPAGAASGAAALDRADAWLGSLAAHGDLADGRAQVRAAWPRLAEGLALHDAAYSPEIGDWHGLVPEAASKTGPFAAPDRTTSPSSLEQLAKCPLAWFYKYGLRLQLPIDVEFDATQWLDPLQRGTLVHRMLEQFVTAWLDRQDQIDDPAAEADLFAIADRGMTAMRQQVPPPSELIFTQERDGILQLLRQFLALEREDRTAQWQSVEQWFPARGQQATFTDADGFTLRISGKIDRVDRLNDGTLRIVDYKTGSSYSYRRSGTDAPLKGGRLLQPVIYAEGARQALGSEVSCFEYRFPKERAPHHRVSMGQDEFTQGRTVVASLLSHLQRGHFIPTDDAGDCKFCDFADICRVSVHDRDVNSPRAAWAAEHGAVTTEYKALRALRGEETAS